MKARIQCMIAAILLGAGLFSAPHSAGAVIARKASEIKHAIDNRLQQCAVEAPFMHNQWADKMTCFHRGAVITINKGKCSSLLWHRFSLTPHTEFIRWIARIWNYHPTFVLPEI